MGFTANLFIQLDVLKQMFDAFINRILAYNYETHVGMLVNARKSYG